MPNSIAPPFSRELDAAIDGFDESLLSRARRRELLERFATLPSLRERAGRYWRVDLETIDLSNVDVEAEAEPPLIASAHHPALIATSLADACVRHKDLVARAFGTAVNAGDDKFAALAAALCNTGAFVYVPADVAIDDPISIEYRATRSLFPYTLVVLERGARCTVIERIRSTSDDGAFVAGIVEIVAGENAHAIVACVQDASSASRIFSTRIARPAKDARIEWAVAELGADLSVGRIGVEIDAPGTAASVTSLFFPTGSQHVDLVSTVSHNVGDSQSETLVKSAAAGAGQARFLGNIRIAAKAQATNASLRDDALLLSKQSHIDSVPALEIAANEVKAFHGATVGAIDEEQIFYMTSRGIDRTQAEKMIALGFFEPAIERFPTQALRAELRAALEAKAG